MPSQISVDNRNLVSGNEDVRWPGIVVRKDACRAIHPLLFEMFLERFRTVIVLFGFAERI
ncbi:hypothetical protein SAMD00023353_6500200 [Rosellinia necatrix]|uniref:Uncharacterized protein n=1 Tax=Rosellinia necatrix TaxID=77044 RepID=A0A1S8AAE1_ROSNE|nr:hypothetical protein SAMD00023353_6500200 [Rosellinia necatrix]